MADSDLDSESVTSLLFIGLLVIEAVDFLFGHLAVN